MNDHSRFIVGIDLGTTHSSVAYIDTDSTKNPSLGVTVFPLLQMVREGLYRKESLLPSCLYLPSEKEFKHINP